MRRRSETVVHVRSDALPSRTNRSTGTHATSRLRTLRMARQRRRLCEHLVSSQRRALVSEQLIGLQLRGGGLGAAAAPANKLPRRRQAQSIHRRAQSGDRVAERCALHVAYDRAWNAVCRGTADCHVKAHPGTIIGQRLEAPRRALHFYAHDTRNEGHRGMVDGVAD